MDYFFCSIECFCCIA